jgi:hypothetical protein
MGHAGSHGVTAASLGSLNASHASTQAFAHASSHSVVSQLSAYAAALNNGLTPANIAIAAQSLAKAANHSLTPAVVTTVNNNLTAKGVLSVSVSPSVAAQIAAQANADR